MGCQIRPETQLDWPVQAWSCLTVEMFDGFHCFPWSPYDWKGDGNSQSVISVKAGVSPPTDEATAAYDARVAYWPRGRLDSVDCRCRPGHWIGREVTRTLSGAEPMYRRRHFELGTLRVRYK